MNVFEKAKVERPLFMHALHHAELLGHRGLVPYIMRLVSDRTPPQPTGIIWHEDLVPEVYWPCWEHR